MLQSGATSRAQTQLELGCFTLSVRTTKVLRWGGTQKHIIGPITATFQSGVLNVIIGPSGSGKSSLLHAIGQRFHGTTFKTYHRSGRISFDGHQLNPQRVRETCSYVQQQDELLLPALTVRETLRYAATLRLPGSMSSACKIQRSESVLRKLGLGNCADSLVGNESFRGISGGEKRRLSLAIQMLTDPQVLLVDEPTSGLDAFTARNIIYALRDLALEGRTVIMAIHQPRSDVFKLFGSILLLCPGGLPAYFGSSEHMLPYFRECGYNCPSRVNPADFAIDLVSNPHHQNAGGPGTQKMVELWRDRRLTTSRTIEDEISQNSTSPTDSSFVLKTSAVVSEEPEVTRHARKKLRMPMSLLLHRCIVNTRR